MIQQIEILAKQAVIESESFNSNARKTHSELFNLVQKSSNQLLRINDYAIVGTAYAYMLAEELTDNQDILQAMTNNAFYCLSKAIEKNPTNYSLKKKRLMLYDMNKDAFNILIICALNMDLNPMGNRMYPVKMQARDAIYKMEIIDLFDPDKKLQEDWVCKNKKPQYEKMLKENFFGKKTLDELKKEGQNNINKCIEWLRDCYSQY
jgi:hypothetical protein